MNFVSIQLDNTCDEPLYLQLFGQIKKAILATELTLGQKLPPIRTLASNLGVNNVTVINAYKALENAGYVASKKGSGYYITSPTSPQLSLLTQPPLAGQSHFINFSSASPDPSIFPTDSFKACLNEVIERDKGYAFGYQDTNGYIPLREVLSHYLLTSHQIQTDAQHIQIVSGAQQGIDLIAKACLSSGDHVITEMPTYNGATNAFKSRGARIVTVTLGHTGIDLDELEKKVKVCRPKLVYVMTHFQNPTTICYSKATLLGLLDLAYRYQFYLVEDDSMWELSYSNMPLWSLKSLDQKDCVIYIKSFSKLLMPGLRMGLLVIPDALLEGFTSVKQMTDIASSGLMHRSLDLFFRQHKWDEHLGYMQMIYRTKYQLMLGLLEPLKTLGISFHIPEGGLCFWLRLPKNMSAQKLYTSCLERGLLILPSELFFSPIHKEKDRYLRLSFASCTPDEIAKGTQLFVDALHLTNKE
ncbi:MAG: PLP-dependent aminotransferase family protein [Cellulosilyticaceae bacterium]